MADTPNTGAQELTGSVPFFKNPEPLDPQRHGSLGLRRSDKPFAFASQAHVCPITVGEFGSASLEYPVIFIGETKTPVCVMGLRENESLFIEEDGSVDPDVYIPAFIRRYPFTFAEDKQSGNFIVCIDAGSDLVGENAETPFFENGQPTKYTQDAIEFLKNFEQQRRLTLQLIETLTEHDLFENKVVNFQPRNPDGSLRDPVKVAEYFAVSQEKLNQLPTETFMKLRDNGALTAIYVHAVSLLNWQKIINKALRKTQPVEGGSTMDAAPAN